MISNHRIALRKESWTRLETLAQQVETSSLKTLSSADLREFGLLYRQAAADLSAVRSMKSSSNSTLRAAPPTLASTSFKLESSLSPRFVIGSGELN